MGVFKTISRFEIVPTYPGRVVPRKDYFGSEIQREILVQGFSWNLFEALGIFWVLIFAPFLSSLSLEILSTPPSPPRTVYAAMTMLSFFCLFYDRRGSNKNLEIQQVTFQK